MKLSVENVYSWGWGCHDGGEKKRTRKEEGGTTCVWSIHSIQDWLRVALHLLHLVPFRTPPYEDRMDRNLSPEAYNLELSLGYDK